MQLQTKNNKNIEQKNNTINSRTLRVSSKLIDKCYKKKLIKNMLNESMTML